MKKIWTCKIGELPREEWETQEGGQDAPMRQAVRRAYIEVTGKEPDYIFSGWAGALTEGERACVESRTPNPALTDLMPSDARAILAAIDLSYPANDPDKLTVAISRLRTIATREDI